MKSRSQKGLDQDWILKKMQNFCAFQERTIQDVRTKLTEMNLQEKVADRIIAELLRDNYLNEERYAKVFAGSKFRMNKWGKNKIIAALQQKEVPDIYIQMGLMEIDEKEYVSALTRLIVSKNKEITDNDPLVRKRKIAKYLISKGFESRLVWDIMNTRK
jgi:regulatory protein